jgi:hypothetical protein
MVRVRFRHLEPILLSDVVLSPADHRTAVSPQPQIHDERAGRRITDGVDPVAQSLPEIRIAGQATWLGDAYKPVRTRRRSLNWTACNGSLRVLDSLTVRFDPDMARHAASSSKRSAGALPISPT